MRKGLYAFFLMCLPMVSLSAQTQAWLERLDARGIVGQLQWLALRPPVLPPRTRTVTPRVRELMQSIQPGGVILFQENLESREQLLRLVRDLQALSKVPLLISLDEEGGGVSRLGNVAAIGFRKRPSGAGWAAMSDEIFARETAAFAREMRVLGINLNLAPVADLNLRRGNPMRHRSMGSDPLIVSARVGRWVDSFQAARVGSTLKHFPGLGTTAVDTHHDAVVLEQTKNAWLNAEGRVFRAGAEAGAEAMMVAHVSWPAVDPSREPVTFSRPILEGLIRGEWKYDGLLITDALDMAAVTLYYTTGEAALKAVKAGVDVASMSTHPLEVQRAFLEAWESDPEFRSRAQAAVERQLRIKARLEG